MSVPAKRTLYTLLLLTFILLPIISFLPFLDGGDRGEERFNDDPDIYVSAADYAFSIWSVIFIGMIAFSWGQFKRKEAVITSSLHRAMVFLIIAAISSMVFTPLSFTDNQLFIWLAILVNLISLIVAVNALRKHAVQTPGDTPWRWTYFAPSIYLGWISAAFVISTALMLTQTGYAPEPDLAKSGAMFLLAVLFFIGRFLIEKEDLFYGLTIIWALVAVGVKQDDPPGIRWVAWGAAATLAILILARYLGKQRLFYAK